MKVQNVKGCLDYLPEEQRVRDYINEVLRDTFTVYGYQSIETPIINYLDMLTDKYDSENDLLKEIYTLTDQGKRSLGLRYDLTVPFAKFIALNKKKIRLPFKRYEIAKVFRDGPVKVGRDREFTQCDVDVVGVSGQMIEAECLSIYVSAFNKLKIDIKIKYNSRNLMRGLMLASGISEDLIKKTITVIDKMDKVSRDELKLQLEGIGLDEKEISALFKYFSLSLDELTDLFEKTEIEELRRGLNELNRLNTFIKELRIDEFCYFTPTLARGQDYYTGNVFEVYEANGKISGSIGGGGRYDNMITNFIDDGTVYPAVGISFGLSSIYELLMMNKDDKTSSDINLYLIPASSNEEVLALNIANKLREEGIKVELEMNGRKIKKCFEWASKMNIAYVSVIGETEVKENKIYIKDMIKEESMPYKLDDIDGIVKMLKK